MILEQRTDPYSASTGWRPFILVRWASVLLFTTLLFVPLPELAPTDDGWFVIAHRVRDLILFSLFLSLLVLLGLAILRLVRARPSSESLEIAAAYLVGTTVLGGIFLVLGLGGIFHPMALKALSVVVFFGVTADRNLEAAARSLVGMRGELRSLMGRGWGRQLFLLVAAILSIMMVFTLGPLVGWDGPMYHIGIPAEFLQEGRIFLPDDNLHVAFISAPQMVAAVPLAVGTTAFLPFTQAISYMLILTSVGVSLSKWTTTQTGLLTVLLMFASSGLLMVSTIDNVDSTMVLAVLLVIIAIAWASLDAVAIPIRFIGLVTGAAMMTKYQAIPYLIGASAVLFFLLLTKRCRATGHELLIGVTLSLVLFAPFLLKNWILLGAPLYPFLAEARTEPWLASIGIDLSHSTSQFAVVVNAREKFSFFDWLFRPGSLTVEVAGSLFGFPLVYLIGLMATFTPKRKLAIYLTVPAVIGVLLILSVSPFTNLRYMLPVIALFAMTTAIAISEVIARADDPMARALVVAVAFIALLPIANWVRFDPGGLFQVGIGAISEQEWADRPANASHRKVRDLSQYLAALPTRGNERILLLYEARGFLLRANVIQDNGSNAWSYLAAGLDEGQCTDPSIIRYVVRGVDTLRYLVSKGVSEEQLAVDEWDDFVRRCLVLRDEIPGYEIYAVKRIGEP